MRNRYLATFYDNVVISQDQLPLVQAALMQVDFLPRGSATDETTAAPAAPATDQSTPPAPAAPPVPQAPPASQPQQSPIIVTWDGKMHMVPTDESKAERLDPGESIVTLTGTPVHLHHVSPEDGTDSTGTCAKLVYHTADSSVHLIGDENFPMLVSQKRENNGLLSTLTGNSLLYSRLNQIAVVEGAGKAHFPDPNEPNTAIDASWDKSCIVHLTSLDGGTPQITSADLAGQVTVDHPRFELSADDLGLVFGEPLQEGTSRQLKSVRATGNAQCVVHETDQTARSLSGQELQLFTARDPTGRLFAKTIKADGARQLRDRTISTPSISSFHWSPSRPRSTPILATTKPRTRGTCN